MEVRYYKAVNNDMIIEVTLDNGIFTVNSGHIRGGNFHTDYRSEKRYKTVKGYRNSVAKRTGDAFNRVSIDELVATHRRANFYIV